MENDNWNDGAYFAAKDIFETILERIQPVDCSDEERDAWVNSLSDMLDKWGGPN